MASATASAPDNCAKTVLSINLSTDIKMYPTAEEFKNILRSTPIETIVTNHLLTGIPFAFRDTPQHLDIIKEHLSSRLFTDQSNIYVIGSARFGFSLSPDNFPRQFSSASDIDIAIVDESLFDTVWFAMLRWHYPRRGTPLDRSDRDWCNVRKKDLYWGWFVPSKITFDGLTFPQELEPIRELKRRWFNTFSSFSQYSELNNREINGRLYRSLYHVILYHSNGLQQIKDLIR